MQWLIDLVIEAMSDVFLQTGYVLRGTRGNIPDFDLIDFTVDGLWHDLDLSGIAPAGAKAVNMKFRGGSNNIGDSFKWRAKGETHGLFTCFYRPQVAGVDLGSLVALDIDTNRIGQYNVSGVGWYKLSINVTGWWL